jgi:putative heme-binding domain-containing protein
VDNDPDASPPCRLVHVVEGGDYGFQFRYGRSGRHPFQSWHGQLPGTLPMAAGTGEGPCEVVAYESDGLPRDYLGSLLVAAWADHRIERYVLKDNGASVRAEWQPFVRGGPDFRPVGIAVAPDGSLYISDWVLKDYNLHHRGAIWHVRPRAPVTPDRPADPQKALTSAHRPLRDAAARQLAGDDAGRASLRLRLSGSDIRARAASLRALIDRDDRTLDLTDVAERDPHTAIRAKAVRALVERGNEVSHFFDAKYPPAVRAEAVAALTRPADTPRLLALLSDADPFLRHAAVQQLARCPDILAAIDVRSLTDPRQRAGVLLAARAAGRPDAARFLADPDEEVRLLAAKWVADDKLAECRPQVAEALADPRLSIRLVHAFATALARLDGRDTTEAALAGEFLARATDGRAPAAQRVAALRLVPASHKKLTLGLLQRLLTSDDPAVRLEVVRALGEHPDPKRFPLLLDLARDGSQPGSLRARAVVGLAERAPELVEEMVRFTRDDDPAVRDEALRAMAGVKLTQTQQDDLKRLAERQPETAALVARALGQTFATGRPAADDPDAWLRRLDGPADAAAGRRVFFHPRLANCARCHRAEGRGADVGPDLSAAGRTDRRHIVESILRPSALVAPHFQVWRVETADGKVHTGLLVRTHLDEDTYLDADGKPFTLNTRDVVNSQTVPASIMPDGLVDRLTDQELRDLLAYLASCR